MPELLHSRLASRFEDKRESGMREETETINNMTIDGGDHLHHAQERITHIAIEIVKAIDPLRTANAAEVQVPDVTGPPQPIMEGLLVGK